MRYPEGHKEAVHETIVQSAARVLRKNGLEGVSIPALMKEAGLTHGGFYTHFANRDELVAEAVVAAAHETGKGVFSDERDLEEALRVYLSPEHVAWPEHGCVVAALGAEARHQPAPVRRAFAYAARGLIDLVDRKLRKTKRASHRPSDEALVRTACMVGAIVLARLVDDPSLGERILAAARKA